MPNTAAGSADARLTDVSDPGDSWRSLRPHGAAGEDHPFFILNVPDHHEMVRARTELTALLTEPEFLRVRRWKPSHAEIDRVQDWIWNKYRTSDPAGTRITMTAPHPKSGLLMITFSRIDREFADELEYATDGLAYVTPRPETIVPLTTNA
jgi:hypothetical protein